MRKNKLKIVAVVALIAVMAVLFTACGKVDFTYVQRKDGTYQQIIDITLDEAQLSGTGYTVATAIPKLNSVLTEEGYTVTTYADNSARITASRIFASLQDLQNNYLGNGLSTESAVMRNEAFYVYQDVEGTAKISFDYITNSTENWLKLILLKNGIIDFQGYTDLIASMDSSYSYATPYKSVTSNADSVVKTSDGYYVHTWNLDDNAKVGITLSTVRGAVWYAVAILVAVASFAVFAIAKVVASKRKTNKQLD